MSGRKHRQAILDEIRRVGGTIDKKRNGGSGHLIVYWSLGGKKFWETISSSPSNLGATNSGVAAIRRRARQAGNKQCRLISLIP